MSSDFPASPADCRQCILTWAVAALWHWDSSWLPTSAPKIHWLCPTTPALVLTTSVVFYFIFLHVCNKKSAIDRQRCGFWVFFFFFLFSIISETWRVKSTACLHQTFLGHSSTLSADRKDVEVVLFSWKGTSISFIIFHNYHRGSCQDADRAKVRAPLQRIPARKLRSSILVLFPQNMEPSSRDLKVQDFFWSHHQQAALTSLGLCENFALVPQVENLPPAQTNRKVVCLCVCVASPERDVFSCVQKTGVAFVKTCWLASWCHCSNLGCSDTIWPPIVAPPAGLRGPGATRSHEGKNVGLLGLLFRLGASGHVKNELFTLKYFWLKWKLFALLCFCLLLRVKHFLCLLVHPLTLILVFLVLPSPGAAFVNSGGGGADSFMPRCAAGPGRPTV